jgi:hypothetical protein
MWKFNKRVKRCSQAMTLFSMLRKTGFALSIVSFLACAIAFAQPEKLPAAGQVLDRYVQVTGGRAAWKSKEIESDDIEGRTLDGTRVVLRATVTISRKGDSLNTIRIPQNGSEGTYNGVAWALTRFSGPRIKTGTEREEAIRDSHILEEADWRSLYPNAKVEGVENVGPRRCYKVALRPGKTEWFDRTSGLLVRRQSSELSSTGETSVGYTVEQWTENGGLNQPSAMLAWRGDFQYRLRVLSTTYNDRSVKLRYPDDVAEYVKLQKAGKALPNAEEIVERHVYESGGPEFYEMLRTQKVSGRLTFVARNLAGRMETWASSGGKYYQSTDIPGMGKQEEGSDGLVSWDRSPVIGPRVKTQKSSATLGVTLDAARMIEWRELIEQVRTEAEEHLDGHDCYRVRLVPRDGSEAIIRWYDRDTGLLYRESLTLRTDMGTIPVVISFEQYEDVSDAKWPQTIRVTASGQDTIFEADEVKLNEPLDEKVFDLPDEIRELARRKTDAADSGSAAMP